MSFRMGTFAVASAWPRFYGGKIRAQYYDVFPLRLARSRIFSHILHVCRLLGTGKDIQFAIFLDCVTGLKFIFSKISFEICFRKFRISFHFIFSGFGRAGHNQIVSHSLCRWFAMDPSFRSKILWNPSKNWIIRTH